MERQITLLSALLLSGTALAQTGSAPATVSTTIGDVIITRPQTVPQEAVEAAAAVLEKTPMEQATPATDAPAAPTPDQTGLGFDPIDMSFDGAEVSDTTVAGTPAPVQPSDPSQPVTVAAPTVQPVTLPEAPAPLPMPAADQTAEDQAPAVKSSVPAQAEAPAAQAPAQQSAQAQPGRTAGTAAPAKAAAPQVVDAPAALPSGWRHLSGQLLGQGSQALPAGSKVQIAIEAVDRQTGKHTAHLVVGYAASELPAGYFLNYNPSRLDTKRYDYVLKAKVFAADGDMLYMTDAEHALPTQTAVKLDLNMRG